MSEKLYCVSESFNVHKNNRERYSLIASWYAPEGDKLLGGRLQMVIFEMFRVRNMGLLFGNKSRV